MLLKCHLSFVPKVPIGSWSALVQVMAWGQTGPKPLPEPMLIKMYGIAGQ